MYVKVHVYLIHDKSDVSFIIVYVININFKFKVSMSLNCIDFMFVIKIL